VPVHYNGDCFDRYMVRLEEMRQSTTIINQCIDWLRANPGPVITDSHKVAPPSRLEMKSGMEDLIHHFKLFTEGYHTQPVISGDTLHAVTRILSCERVTAGAAKSTSATELPNTSCSQRTLPGGDSVSSAPTSRRSWLSRGRSISRCWPKATGRA